MTLTENSELTTGSTPTLGTEQKPRTIADVQRDIENLERDPFTNKIIKLSKRDDLFKERESLAQQLRETLGLDL